MARIRLTKQNKELEYAINAVRDPFTSDELHSKVKDKNIGVATIYRFLKEQVSNHKIHHYQCNRKSLYSKSKLSHCHFTCEKCKSIIHFNVKDITSLKSQLPGNPCHIQIDVTGICNKCKLKE